MLNEFIKEALEHEYIHSRPIEDFTIDGLDILSEMAKKNNLIVTLKAEHSNVHQGVLVGLIKRNIADKFIKYL